MTKASLYKGISEQAVASSIGDIGGYAVQGYCEDAGFSGART